jgi:hypothetical protein
MHRAFKSSKLENTLICIAKKVRLTLLIKASTGEACHACMV